jgi:cysteine desulfurase
MIYLDNAATTPMDVQVISKMTKYFALDFANASASYSFADRAKEAVDDARDFIADMIGAKSPSEIYFTSGGSEGDNWALTCLDADKILAGRKGNTLKASSGQEAANDPLPCDPSQTISDNRIMAVKAAQGHIITQKTEHHAVLNTCAFLEKKGIDVTYLNVDEYGLVDPADVEKAVRPDTFLISIMMANNETGTIQPVKEIGRIAHDHGICFFTDAVQAFGHIPINVRDQNIDMMSVSAHKFNGPKGVGFMYIKNGIPVHSLIHGGAQERGRRAGTTNVPGIAGLAEAARLKKESMARDIKYVSGLRDSFERQIIENIEGVKINGFSITDIEGTDRSPAEGRRKQTAIDGAADSEYIHFRRLPNNLNICIPGISAEALLILLDRKGICASAGSACATGSLEPSHVLRAIGLSNEDAAASIRFSLSEQTTEEEIKETVKVLRESVRRLRSLM